MHDKLDLKNASNNVELIISGQSHWVPAIPMPFYTPKGLSFWKRLGGEKNWRPQCKCDQLFETLDDYNAHVVFWNSVYGIALLQARGQWGQPPVAKPAPEPIIKEEAPAPTEAPKAEGEETTTNG